MSHAPYGHVTLTEEGTRIAAEVEQRHVLIRDFLTGVLSLPEDKAEVTACRMEHVLEPDVLAHFVAYSERLQAGCEPRRGSSGSGDMISLDQLPSCTPAVVVSLPQGRGVAQRLLALGLSPGAEIQGLQNRGSGPLIVEVHGVRLALGRGQAARVTCSPLTEAECSEADRPGADRHGELCEHLPGTAGSLHLRSGRAAQRRQEHRLQRPHRAGPARGQLAGQDRGEDDRPLHARRAPDGGGRSARHLRPHFGLRRRAGHP